MDLRSPAEIRDGVDERENRFFKETRSWQEVWRDQNVGTDIQKSLIENNTDQLVLQLQETLSEDIKFWLPYIIIKTLLYLIVKLIFIF